MAKSRTSKTKGRATQGGTSSAAALGFERDLWRAADALRSNMDAAEYKHVVLGLIFLKYISDAFEGKHAALEADRESGADPEDPDEYRAENIFWVPPGARWSHLLKMAKQPTIGKVIDDAMLALPGQLFYSTPIPVCLWFLARDKKNGRFRDRRGQTLFIFMAGAFEKRSIMRKVAADRHLSMSSHHRQLHPSPP